VTDPSGPYYHQVVAARTSDGLEVRDARQVLDHASVPDGVRMPDGSVRVYYVNGAEGQIWVALLGEAGAAPLGPIRLDGVEGPAGIVDPDATLLPDGRVRLAYLSGFGSPGTSGERAMCLADSEDGVSFRLVGPALAVAEMDTDPSLAPLAGGAWLMAVSRGQQTLLARSADGLRFTLEATLTIGGVPELAVLSDGRLRLYVCARGIESHVSADAGRTWRAEGTVVPPGTLGKRIVCDPSRVAGTDVFLFKTAD
jgi:hypothetical protein